MTSGGGFASDADRAFLERAVTLATENVAHGGGPFGAIVVDAAGTVIGEGTNELVIPNYKQTWANIRKISDAPEGVKHLSFKSLEYTAG